MEVLFQKAAPVLIKKGDREENHLSVGVSIIMNNINTPVHKKELVIRLTNEMDPFFLYTLTINEEDFQQLKIQQGLLIDFISFPQKLIDLLELCLAEIQQESPKFVLHLKTNSSSTTNRDMGLATFDIVETNPFRHLTHLSLQLVPASDVHLKKYLAECMLSLKEKVSDLTQQLKVTKSDLTSQLVQSEEVLSHRTQELEKLKSDWSAHSSSLTNEHNALLTTTKEKMMKVQIEMQEKHTTEKKEIESTYSLKIETLEQSVKELDTTVKELTDRKYRSEAAIRELKAKLKGNEEELINLRQSLQTIRTENNALDSEKHQLTKSLNQTQTRVAVLEQELKDKEQVIQKTNKLLETSNEQKVTIETQLEQQNRHVGKLETAYKQMTQEVAKGNEIIKKLQSEILNLKSKLKSRNIVTTKQEQLLNDKETEIEKLRNDSKRLLENLETKDKILLESKTEISRLQKTIEEQQETLKNNDNVITWLNKQINDRALSSREGMGLTRPQEILSSIRPTHSYVSPLYQQPRFSSTPIGRGNTKVQDSEGEDGRQILGTLQNHPQKVLFRGGPIKHQPSPLAVSMTTPTVTPTTSNLKTSPQNIVPQLERYLPPVTTVTTKAPLSVPINAPAGTMN